MILGMDSIILAFKYKIYMDSKPRKIILYAGRVLYLLPFIIIYDPVLMLSGNEQKMEFTHYKNSGVMKILLV